MLDFTRLVNLRWRRPFALRLRLGITLALSLLLLTGCARKFYRKLADQEVATVLGEKDKYEAWKIEQFHVYPDPRARFADPTNPDCPPMPPDDPAARDLAPNPQRPKKAGVAYVAGSGYLDLLAAFDAQNRSRLQDDPAIQKTAATSYDPGTQDEKGYLLSLEQAVELGLINSREYQDRREDLYLLALPVTLERFAFASQWFATNETIRQWFGRESPEGHQNRWVSNSNVGFSKLFPTGALLLLQWANRTIVDLTGDLPKHTISESTLNLDLVQPLLRGGGQAVTLEPLTQVERNLLYGIRDYARFRKLFFVNIAGGGQTSRGSVQVAGFGALANLPGTITPTQGYLPILLIDAQLDNEKKNVAQLEKLLAQFRDFQEAGIVQKLQVDQVEQQLLGSRNNVLQTEVNYRDALDRFKLQLGLPPSIPLELDETPMQPLIEQFQRYENVIQQFEAARAALASQEALEQGVGALAGQLTINPLFPTPLGVLAGLRINATDVAPGLFAGQVRPRVNQGLYESALMKGTVTQARLAKLWPVWIKRTPEEMRQRFKELDSELQVLLFEKTRRETEGKTLEEASLRRIEEIEFERDVGLLESALRDFEARPWLLKGEALRLQFYIQYYQRLAQQFFALLTRARLERLDRLTQTWPELPALRIGEVDLLKTGLPEAQRTVSQTALTNRFDVMNARGQLVDSWRQIAVTANALLGVFNVRYNMELFTPFGEAQPANFGGSRYRHQLFLNSELPLVRKLERNDYRAAQIVFQRQRRDLMATEDQTSVAVREEIRQLRQLGESYTIQKRLVELAYLQVENSQEEFNAPPPAPRGADPGRGADLSSSANAAALTRQRLDAQNSLLRAQNQLYQTWINYLTTRLELYRDLELMPLDFRGVWTDELANLSRSSPSSDGRPPADQRPGPERPERLPPPRPLPNGLGQP